MPPHELGADPSIHLSTAVAADPVHEGMALLVPMQEGRL